MEEKIVIIGNGIAGITCARLIRKMSNKSITVISAETPHFYSRTALMYIFMGHMKYEHTKPYEDSFWKKNRIDLVHDLVTSVDAKNKVLVLAGGASISFDKLVLATGSVSNLPDIPGIELPGVQALYGIPDLERMNENSRGVTHAVIAGGGLIGIEMAEMLLSRNIKVTFLVREADYWANVLPAEEAAMISRHIRSHHINLKTETEIKEIIPGVDGRVSAVLTGKGEKIECGFVGIAVGVSPNVELLRNSGIRTKRGILVNHFFETNIQDVYAIGDCVEHQEPPAGRKPVEQVWYTGRMQGETLALTLCGKRTGYKPGPWFNSAKFIDIEYQTYGVVAPVTPEDQDSFIWVNAADNVLFRMLYSKESEQMTGINVLGMRLRHELCDAWLREGKKASYVINHLDELNFDAEFAHRYQNEICRAFSHAHNNKPVVV